MEVLATVDDGILIVPSERGGVFEIDVEGVLHSSGTATIHEIPESPLSNLLGSDDPEMLLSRILVDPNVIGQHALVDCAIHLHGVGERDEPIIAFDSFFERPPQR